MFSRILTDHIKVSLSIPQFAEETFDLTHRNRLFLGKWFPWVDGTRSSGDTRAFIESQLQRFARAEGLLLTISYGDSIAGVAGFNSLDSKNGIGTIGYWLGEEFNGKGIMTTVVRDLIEIGREYYGLQRISIRCATANMKSRAIPERLGFTHEGTLRRAEKVHGEWFDHEAYALLIEQGCDRDLK